MGRYSMVDRGQHLNEFAQTIASRWLSTTYMTRPYQLLQVFNPPPAMVTSLDALPVQSAGNWRVSAVIDQRQILQQDQLTRRGVPLWPPASMGLPENVGIDVLPGQSQGHAPMERGHIFSPIPIYERDQDQGQGQSQQQGEEQVLQQGQDQRKDQFQSQEQGQRQDQQQDQRQGRQQEQGPEQMLQPGPARVLQQGQERVLQQEKAQVLRQGEEQVLRKEEGQVLQQGRSQRREEEQGSPQSQGQVLQPGPERVLQSDQGQGLQQGQSQRNEEEQVPEQFLQPGEERVLRKEEEWVLQQDQGKDQFLGQEQEEGQVLRQGEEQMLRKEEEQGSQQSQGQVLQQGQERVLRQEEGWMLQQSQGKDQFLGQEQEEGQVLRQGQEQVLRKEEEQVLQPRQERVLQPGQDQRQGQSLGQNQRQRQDQGQELRKEEGWVLQQGEEQVLQPRQEQFLQQRQSLRQGQRQSLQEEGQSSQQSQEQDLRKEEGQDQERSAHKGREWASHSSTHLSGEESVLDTSAVGEDRGIEVSFETSSDLKEESHPDQPVIGWTTDGKDDADKTLVVHDEDTRGGAGNNLENDMRSSAGLERAEAPEKVHPYTRARYPRSHIEEWISPPSVPVSKVRQPEKKPARSKQELTTNNDSDMQTSTDSVFQELLVHFLELTNPGTAQSNVVPPDTMQGDAKSSGMVQSDAILQAQGYATSPDPVQNDAILPDPVQSHTILPAQSNAKPSGAVQSYGMSGVGSAREQAGQYSETVPSDLHQPDQQTRPVAKGSVQIAAVRTHNVLRAQPTPTPLSLRARHFLQPLVGIDLTGIRVHRGILAEQLTTSYRADAITVGGEVAIANGHADDTPETLGLLAHEFTHLARRSNPRFVPPIVRPAKISPTTTSLSPLMPLRSTDSGEEAGPFMGRYLEEEAGPSLRTTHPLSQPAGVGLPENVGVDVLPGGPQGHAPTGREYPTQPDEEGLAQQVESRVAQIAQGQTEQVVSFNTAGVDPVEHQPPTRVPETAPTVKSQPGSWNGLPAPWEPLPNWLDSLPPTMESPNGQAAHGQTGASPAMPTKSPIGIGQVQSNEASPVTTDSAMDTGVVMVQRAGEERGQSVEEDTSTAPPEQSVISTPEPDLDALAQQVHAILKQRLAAEQRRAQR